MMSNYFAKLPRALVQLLFGSSGLADHEFSDPGIHEGPPVEYGSHSAPTLRRLRTTFLEPFAPKADAEYVAHIAQRQVKKSRRHETIVNRFALWLQVQGFELQRNQAIDLAVRKPLVVVEAKVMPPIGFQDLIRQAVGQLYEYRFFQVIRPDAELIFLSSDPLAEHWLRYLEQDRRIGVVWPLDEDFWLSPLASADLGLDHSPPPSSSENSLPSRQASA